MESNFGGEKKKSDRAKKVENTLLSLLFEFVVTPVETVATMVGQGKQIETFNQSLGAADWGDNRGDDPSSGSAHSEWRSRGSNEGNDNWGRDRDR